ncbi:hypothetical protein ND926_22230 [Vibrio diabolicus]|uniref:hypothetical protein n=1 Tax=Vibrio TaxID=662 RepID=UPI000AC27CB8|nr:MULTISPECIES: hypothetical protein [Vibrio harveyi group]EJX2557673.1 hypothetical protein [Vibrio alginolyticus]EHJ9985766.1 hypothetical protein [Vibrio parahaemolyticus]EHR4996292.1 hypothetical protein [Vibrio parahaemolyticus]EHR6686154.1 hypothetical protein [Vibrio parahaemolyticus]EII2983791.1 hypothetical protein [Vibrio parahaemolyticus]
MTLSTKDLACLLSLSVILVLLILAVLLAQKDSNNVFALSLATACISVIPNILAQIVA